MVGDAQRLHDLPRRPVRHADVADVPVLHEDVEGADSLLDRCRRVEAVDLIQVYVVELQPAQAGFAGLDQMQARVAAGIGAGAGGGIALGGDHHAAARNLQVAQRLAGDLLRQPVRVGVRGIDEIHPGLYGAADHPLCICLPEATHLAVNPVAFAAEGHRPEA